MAYADLKRVLVSRHRQDRLRYIAGKGLYVNALEERAVEWARLRDAAGRKAASLVDKPIASFSWPSDDGTVELPAQRELVGTFRRRVTGEVWAGQRKADESDCHAFGGPCEVDGTRWTCGELSIGSGFDHGQTFIDGLKLLGKVEVVRK